MSAHLVKLVLLIVGISFGVISAAAAQEVKVLAEGLAGPTDLVWAFEPNGPKDLRPVLVIAEGETGTLRKWDPESGQLDSVDDAWLKGLAVGTIKLALTENSQLVTAQSSVCVHTPTERSQTLEIRTPDTLRDQPEQSNEATFEQLAVNQRYLFAIHQGRLLQSRSGGKRFNGLRPNVENPDILSDESITALMFNEQGHLVAASSQVGAAKLIFINPHEITPVAEFKVLGLSRIDALKLGPQPQPVNRLLYALVTEKPEGDQEPESNAESGLYRLDSRVPTGGEFRCQAKLVQPIDQPVALDFGPEGNLFVITRDGKLLQIDGQY